MTGSPTLARLYGRSKPAWQFLTVHSGPLIYVRMSGSRLWRARSGAGSCRKFISAAVTMIALLEDESGGPQVGGRRIGAVPPAAAERRTARLSRIAAARACTCDQCLLIGSLRGEHRQIVDALSRSAGAMARAPGGALNSPLSAARPRYAHRACARRRHSGNVIMVLRYCARPDRSVARAASPAAGCRRGRSAA